MKSNRSIILSIVLCCLLTLLAGVVVAVVLKQTGGTRSLAGGGGTPVAMTTAGMTPTPSPTPTLVPTRAPTIPPTPTPVPTSALKVLGIDMSVSPISIEGIPCGTPVTVTYTATFHLNHHNGGGTIALAYTTDGGMSTTQASVQVDHGDTQAQFQFSWAGSLPPDHTRPGLGGVVVMSPNELTSTLVKPEGRCKFPS